MWQYEEQLPYLVTPLTLCPNAPVRYAPVAFPFDKFAEIASRVPNYVSPANK